MRLYYYKNKFGIRNFGDDLNPWVWANLIPEALDDDDSALFVGFGTILNKNMPKTNKIVVFGSGVGYGEAPTIDENWYIYCLRGPLSAKALNVPEKLAITDSSMLIKKLFKADGKKEHRFSFMPHIDQAYFGAGSWKDICRKLGYTYIDPRWPIPDILLLISHTECLITEAMHGAIVADALRTPWIPIKTNKIIFEFKWQDWCSSMGVTYKPSFLMPFWNNKNTKPIDIRGYVKNKLITAQLNNIVKTTRPILSKTSKLNSRIHELEDKMHTLKRDINNGLFKKGNLIQCQKQV